MSVPGHAQLTRGISTRFSMGLSPSIIFSITAQGIFPASLCCPSFRKQVVAETNDSVHPGPTGILEWGNFDTPKSCFIDAILMLPSLLHSLVCSVFSDDAANFIDQGFGK